MEREIEWEEDLIEATKRRQLGRELKEREEEMGEQNEGKNIGAKAG